MDAIADRDVYRALTGYAGDSSFLRSLAVRVRAGHGLTVRQVDAARRVLELPVRLAPTPAEAATVAPRRLSTTQEAAAAGPKYPRPPVPRGPRRLPA